MENQICKKVASMLSLYIENKLDDEEKFFVENHFINCVSCYQKYLEMKKIVNNLHLEYKKLLDEFEKIESNQNFSIREYETFYNNISPYIDDELNYDESIQFRKYILKSKSARTELANAYKLKNNIKRSIAKLKDSSNINFSKRILKKLKEENRNTFDIIYQRAAIILGFTLSTIIIIGVYVSFNYIQEAFTQNGNKQVFQTIDFPKEKDWIEFTYDKNNKALLTQK